MSLADKLAAVQRAEQACIDQRAAATGSLDRLKSELRRGATPVRIVVSGFALGVASGFSAPTVGAAAGVGSRLASGPIFSMRPFSSQTAWSLVLRPPFVRPIP